jgi:methylmalonyl-CoA mutase N-terminal domain/subunit
METHQRERVQALRSRRNSSKVAEMLGKVEATARGNGPLMALFVECVENEVTLGEICEVLRQAWGEYRPS